MKGKYISYTTESTSVFFPECFNFFCEYDMKKLNILFMQ